MNKGMLVGGSSPWCSSGPGAGSLCPRRRQTPPPSACERLRRRGLGAGRERGDELRGSLQGGGEGNRDVSHRRAPGEIKGRWTKLRGELSWRSHGIFSRTHGQIDLDLDDLKTETFGDKDKDEAQTEHAHNWLRDRRRTRRAEETSDNHWARFTVKSIESVTPAKLASTRGRRAGPAR